MRYGERHCRDPKREPNPPPLEEEKTQANEANRGIRMEMKERKDAGQTSCHKEELPVTPIPRDSEATKNNQGDCQAEQAAALWKQHVGNDVWPDDAFLRDVAVVGWKVSQERPKLLVAGEPVSKEIDESQTAV